MVLSELEKKEREKIYQKKYRQSKKGKEVNKKNLLQASYFFTLINYIMSIVSKTTSFTEQKKGKEIDNNELLDKNIYGWFGKCKNEGEITKKVLQIIENPISILEMAKFLNENYKIK